MLGNYSPGNRFLILWIITAQPTANAFPPLLGGNAHLHFLRQFLLTELNVKGEWILHDIGAVSISIDRLTLNLKHNCCFYQFSYISSPGYQCLSSISVGVASSQSYSCLSTSPLTEINELQTYCLELFINLRFSLHMMLFKVTRKDDDNISGFVSG